MYQLSLFRRANQGIPSRKLLLSSSVVKCLTLSSTAAWSQHQIGLAFCSFTDRFRDLHYAAYISLLINSQVLFASLPCPLKLLE